jgi:hypothetical protein
MIEISGLDVPVMRDVGARTDSVPAQLPGIPAWSAAHAAFGCRW